MAAPSGSVSGLARVPDMEQLHQPHQERFTDAPGDRIAVALDFPNFDFGTSNRVYLPPLEMVTENAWVKITLNMTQDGTTPIANQAMPNVQNWVGNQGAQILYKVQGLYNMREPEALIWPLYNTSNARNQIKLQTACNDSSQAQRRLNAATGTAHEYYLYLGPLAHKILNNFGGLGAHAANSWSFDIDIRPLNNLLQGSTATAAVLPSYTISAQLILVGHREDAENMQIQSNYLGGLGIRALFTQSNHIRKAVASADTTTTISLADQEGDVTGILILRRQSAGLTALATTNSTLTNPVNYVRYDDPLNLLTIGTTSNPTFVGGRAMSEEHFRLVYNGYDCMYGAPKYWNGSMEAVDTGANWISLAERGSMAELFGAYSGAIRVKNNFQMVAYYNTTAGSDQYMDVIVYIRRILVLKHEGMAMMNAEG